MADLQIKRNYLVDMKPEVAKLWRTRQIAEKRLTIKGCKQDLIRFESEIEDTKTQLEHMEKVQRVDKDIHIKMLEDELEFLKTESIEVKQIKGGT